MVTPRSRTKRASWICFPMCCCWRCGPGVWSYACVHARYAPVRYWPSGLRCPQIVVFVWDSAPSTGLHVCVGRLAGDSAAPVLWEAALSIPGKR